MTKPPRRFSKSTFAGGAPEGRGARTIGAKRYRLEEIIGRGGMGEVWSAYDTNLGRRVAVKLVELGLEGLDDTEARFALEAVLSRQLRGPAFVEVFAHGNENQTAYLVMELLEGETLEQRLRRKGTLTLAEARDFLNGIGGGLRLAHALQIVHRDLKPANIFFAKLRPNASGARPLDGRTEVLKLLDFGIAKDAWDDARLTKPGVLLGSAHYMSPEQIQSSDVDSRSDLWSLGVLLFRSLTGVRPFSGTAAEALGAIVDGTPPRASEVERKLPRKLDGFFERAFQRNPARRFQTIDEMIDAFGVAAGFDKPAPNPARLSIDIDFDDIVDAANGADAWRFTLDEECDARPTIVEVSSPPERSRPTIPEGRARVITPAPKPPIAGSAIAFRPLQDSDAREALLPLVMPVASPSRPRAIEASRRNDRRTIWALLVVFVLLAVAIGVGLALGDRSNRLRDWRTFATHVLH